MLGWVGVGRRRCEGKGEVGCDDRRSEVGLGKRGSWEERGWKEWERSGKSEKGVGSKGEWSGE